jgi:hypothetical protein
MPRGYIDYKTSSRLDRESVRWQLSLYRYLDGLNYADKATFTEQDHTYRLGDKRLISVTQLLKKHNLSTDFSKVNKDVLNAKSERGTLIHKEIETYLKTGEMGFTSELYDFIEWQEKNQVKAIASEIIVNNDLVAGTVDLIAESPNFTSEIIALHLDGEKCRSYLLEPIPTEEIERLIECERKGEIYQPKELIVPNSALKELYTIELTIQSMEKKKKEMEQAAAETRKLIIKAMKEQGIKSYENDLLKMTYIAPSVRESLDTARLKKELPEVAEKYLRQSQVKESVRITLRGNK